MRIFFIFILVLILSIAPVTFFIAGNTKADEEIFMGDSDSHELILSENEQGMIDRVLLRYEWDEVVTGTTTVKMHARVE